MTIIARIKNKKELKSLPDLFVQNILNAYLSEHKDIILDNPKNKAYKQAVKEVRKLLHEVHGVFKSGKFARREQMLDEIGGIDDLNGHDLILSLHQSTRERLNYYPNLYSQIFLITGKPKSILDLGCGMNPLSFPYMRLSKVKYFASELTAEDAEFLNKYFKKMKIDGEAFQTDLITETIFPQADLCLMFKLLDTLETLKRNISKNLLARLNCKWLVASFPTKTIGGRKEISKKRLVWFEKIIQGKEWKTVEIENEIFYVVRI